jgi:hypothetical protein
LTARDRDVGAGESPRDAIHFSTPRLAIEGANIRPNRRRIQGLVFHARSPEFAGECFVLNEADDARFWDRQLDSEIESPVSGEEGQNPEGM